MSNKLLKQDKNDQCSMINRSTFNNQVKNSKQTKKENSNFTFIILTKALIN